MMKNIFLSLCVALVIGFAACKDDNVTYAEELKAEKKLIEDFIRRQEIIVVDVKPTTFPWPAKVYYKTKTGLYFRLEKQGDISNPADSLVAGDQVVPRFIQYTLNEKADTISNWTTIDFPYPAVFNYRDLTQVCVGWHEAAGLMQYNDSEAKFIVYSKLGFSQYNRPATPIGYDMKIRVKKF
jgi:hypothetical protein